jgi:hypothetical protein
MPGSNKRESRGAFEGPQLGRLQSSRCAGEGLLRGRQEDGRQSDPGSGTSFSIHWTADSKALRIIGDCGGFEASRDSSKWVELDLVYLVGSNEMVTFR